MSEKTKFNNDQEDELNQSRFLAERGAEVLGTQAPGEEENVDFEAEDILTTKSRFREAPSNADDQTEEAKKTPFYGQGFPPASDDGIRREPEPEDKDETDSLGA